MIYELLYSLSDQFSIFNVFRYITFRTILAILTSFAFTFLIAPACIRWLKSLSLTQHIRDDGPKSHLKKEGTPTMGGIIIIASVLVSMLLWGNLSNHYLLIITLSFLGFGAIGFLDDYLKVSRKNYKGLPGRYKLLAQLALATSVTLFLYFNPKDPYTTVLSIPFFKQWLIDLGLFYLPFAILPVWASTATAEGASIVSATADDMKKNREKHNKTPTTPFILKPSIFFLILSPQF